MIRPWRQHLLAAVLFGTATAGVADAQTIIVRHAAPAKTVEITFNGTAVGSAATDTTGDAVVAFHALAKDVNEASIQFAVDACGEIRRILIVDRTTQPVAAGAGCGRRSIIGYYVLRPSTTFVIDIGPLEPTVLLRQGHAPESWVKPGAHVVLPGTTPGLVAFTGSSFTTFRDNFGLQCGGVSPCTGKEFRPTALVGGTYWFSRFVGAEFSMVKGAQATAVADGANFHFDTTTSVRMFTFSGKAGGGNDTVRAYVGAGVNYSQTTVTTVQTFQDRTATVDGEPVVFKGFTESLPVRTGGWGASLGGGIEVWPKPPLGVYFEAGLVRIKGTDLYSDDGTTKDRLIYLTGGVRVRLGRVKLFGH